MTGWRPISTAPKDDWVLLARPKGPAVVGRWQSHAWADKPRPFWAAYSASSITEERHNQPTHWQPLPELPKPTEAE